jgi:hypothetical protein
MMTPKIRLQAPCSRMRYKSPFPAMPGPIDKTVPGADMGRELVENLVEVRMISLANHFLKLSSSSTEG